HYRALIAVSDEKKRLALAVEASKGEWSSRDLEIEIRNLLWDARVEKSDGKAPSLLPVPEPGPLFTYKIIRPETIHSRSNELLIDLGFSTVLELNRVSNALFKPDTIVTSSKDAKGRYSLRSVPSSRPLPGGEDQGEGVLYTYQAFVERVIDGDTLKVEIDLGFNIRIRQTLRLKGIDCPEMGSAEGKAAKRFVENALQGLESITLKSTQTRKEKWGRYLGDVFCMDKTGKQQYLNNALLEKGQAVRVRE
ncbi:MAG: thermonuclease family protein, partial [Candidatus Omnitrophica bacterium]|nr:thermonuclease family protein [Candidatus Omnitrophota bacterium]